MTNDDYYNIFDQRLSKQSLMKEMTHVLGNAMDDKTLRTRMGDIPDLSRWMEDNIPESLTVFRLPRKHWKRLRTSNLAERQMKEIKKRTKVAMIFPNKDSLNRLVSALLMEIDETWATGKRYLDMETE